MKYLGIALSLIVLTGAGLMIKSLNAEVIADLSGSTHYHNGKFVNDAPTSPNSLSKTLKIMWRFITEKRVDTEPNLPLPMKYLTAGAIAEIPSQGIHLVKLGHSSFLMKVEGEYWLLDPVFSERASPFRFLGPKRFQDTPISLEDLPPIDRVLISHNHYDHLDKQTITLLKSKVANFYVPLGVEGDLQRFGIQAEKIHSFDWWQSRSFNNTTIAFTPTQHFSGRGLGDANATLWGSWVIKTPAQSVYFSGDSGYFDGFKTIGDKYGPFDLTLIETGAYDKDWQDIHMTPEQSVQAHSDLKGKVMMPIHNGTFDLAFHAWYEPLDRVSHAAAEKGVSLTTPIVGEVVTVGSDYPESPWWTSLK
ncbi:MBL fold metallo-hydrolase [Aestuariibacter sp. GS-14]|uniref:MBL fold metallo-hydrolase n=1 Tax=Aestuariibacter sp. GS-14 TaxID=2590670 RepID=UPI0021081407|nr:MBL fold metallo-hydrolase [Aestuariibacter sp. GS-14]